MLGRAQYDMKALLRQLRQGSNQSGRLLWDFLSASFHQNNISNWPVWRVYPRSNFFVSKILNLKKMLPHISKPFLVKGSLKDKTRDNFKITRSCLNVFTICCFRIGCMPTASLVLPPSEISPNYGMLSWKWNSATLRDALLTVKMKYHQSNWCFV